jgi:flagellar biosynthetic protein FliR
VTSALETAAFSVFLLFCRIGGCVLFAPGLSSVRIPMQIRLLVCLGVTLSLAPLLHAGMTESIAAIPPTQRPLLIIKETLVGSAIGIMGRIFLLSLQFAATAIANMIGLAGIPGVPMEEMEAGSPLATLASTSAVMIILTTGLHIEMLGAIIDSYRVMAVGASLRPDVLLANIMKTVTETSVLALRLSAPFIAYGVLVNVAIGLSNRFTPQISVYHVTTGAVMLGGFLLLHTLWGDWMLLFIMTYEAWIMRGGF